MADIAIIIGKAFGKSLAEVNKFSTGLLEIIDGIPGKMGDKLRAGADKVMEFVNRIDSLLRGLHKIFNSIPDGLGPAIQSMVDIFKKGAEEINNTVIDGFELPDLGPALDDIARQAGGAASKTGSDIGVKFSTGFLGALSNITAGVGLLFGAKGQGPVGGAIMGGVGGFLGLTGIAKLMGLTVTGIGGPIGIAAIGVGALLGALFGRKSDEEKKAEQEAKKQAGLRTEELMNSIQQGIIETMSKGFDLLQKIEGFSEVPLKAIKRFINQLTFVMEYFVEATKGFKVEATQHAKTIADNLGSSFELMMSGVDLINAIKTIEEISDEQIAKFVATTLKIAEGWIAAANEIELGVAKRAGKISEKLQLSFAFLRVIPETLEALVKASEITLTDEMIAKPIADARRILEKFFDLAEDLAGMALNRATKASDKFKIVFENAKIIFESIATIGQYKPIEDAVFDGVKNDFVRILDFIDSLIGMGEEGIQKSETLGDVVRRMAESLGASLSGISALAGGGSSGAGDVGSQGFAVPSVSPVATPNVPAGATSSGTASAQGGVTVNVNQTINGSLIKESEVNNRIVEGIISGVRGGRLNPELVTL
jgi:hypothetical protein